eukprot:NODE_5_length_3916_cov_139.898112_g4_i0.p1 GENE.NODE_5_length_3916_cov_139.898112_g4_i0~~NODE_5_length_3916_cov_139.898112_g4_i0.p1  ORF type:complete len:783 (+),score=66.13 NODE_5_length_3916_cov_139.898112_g4_i0:1377-3725(+)
MGVTQGVENLDEFFARPVKIASSTWAVTQGLEVPNLQVWKLWMQNPRVANRLSNYKNFRGKLHVKFIINGNSFYWGRAFASYTPFNKNPFGAGQAASWLDYPSATMRPHIWIDPTTSQGGEMVLPFFWPDDHFNLTTNDPAQLGNIWMHSPVLLQHAQSVSQPLVISVYAWATDVTLATPTQVNITGLTPQSGDEYGSGPISRPANMVAAIAGSMSKAPIIGPYAMATQMAASAVGRVAQLFGYSRPREISEICTTRFWQTGNLASTDQPDTAMTLGFTSKQEVTLDPRTVGLGGQDEMDFKHLMAKPTLFASFNWEYASVINKALFSVRVNPMVYRRASYLSSRNGYALTPTALCGLPFRYWRGSMTYRFSVVGSGYHKGRLLFVWEPVTPPGDPLLNPPETNVTYSKIVDIAKERDFSITIGYAAHYAGLQVPLFIQNDQPDMFSVGYPMSFNSAADNGILTCYVLNTLVSSGSDTNPISILVHTSSDDMEFWSPKQDNLKDLTYNVQGVPPRSVEDLLDAQAGTVGDIEPGPEAAAEETRDLGTVGGDPLPATFGIFTAGETVRSFRTLLKRYTLRRSIVINDTVPTGNIASIYWTGLSYPYFTDSPYTGLDGGIFNGPFTIHALIAGCFSGWRGSYRIKLLPAVVGNGDQWSSTSLTVCRGSDNTLLDPQVELWSRDTAGMNAFDAEHDYSWGGAQMSNPSQGNVCDFEIPYYSGTRFVDNKVSTFTSDLSYDATLLLDNPGTGSREVFSVIREYGAVGEDYNLFFFLGVPPIWSITP